MFSLMRTGMCRRPSWTPIVSPTISGMIIEARDQVRITFRDDARWARRTRIISFSSTNGPFLMERDM
jgi:hypothetical protein